MLPPVVLGTSDVRKGAWTIAAASTVARTVKIKNQRPVRDMGPYIDRRTGRAQIAPSGRLQLVQAVEVGRLAVRLADGARAAPQEAVAGHALQPLFVLAEQRFGGTAGAPDAARMTGAVARQVAQREAVDEQVSRLPFERDQPAQLVARAGVEGLEEALDPRTRPRALPLRLEHDRTSAVQQDRGRAHE